MVDLPLAFYRWFWWGWLMAFIVVETLAILDTKPGDTLTENIRPLMQAHPLTWFMAFGFLTWLWIHFLIPAAERALVRFF